MLIERLVADEPFVPRCTIRGGVLPGGLRLTTLRPGALLGVSNPAVPALVDLLKRGASRTCSCFGGDAMPASASNACVALENLSWGGGSPSVSLSSSMPMRCIMGASAEKPLGPKPDKGELRRARPG